MALPYVTESQAIMIAKEIVKSEGGGSSTDIMDIREEQAADQSVLAKIYNEVPQTLRITAVTDGIQMYRLQVDGKNYSREEIADSVIYSCVLFGSIISIKIHKDGDTYTLEVI